MLPKLLDPRPYFAHLPDPRRETRNTLHPLRDILMIVGVIQSDANPIISNDLLIPPEELPDTCH